MEIRGTENAEVSTGTRPWKLERNTRANVQELISHHNSKIYKSITHKEKIGFSDMRTHLHIPQMIHRKAKNFEFLEKTTASPPSAENTDSENMYLVSKSQKSATEKTINID